MPRPVAIAERRFDAPSVTADINALIEQELGERPTHVRSLAGGHTGPIVVARLPSAGGGEDIVVKLGRADDDALLREARMLMFLDGKAPVPRVIKATGRALAMEYVDGTAGAAGAGAHLAEVLSALHDVTAPQFGFAEDTVIGGLRQPNAPTTSWTRFFAEQRLLALLPDDTALAQRIERLAAKIADVVDEPDRPRLGHGDLWSGNVLTKRGRVVALIDPALAFVDAEADLALLDLFGGNGGVDDAFWPAYFERRPPRPGRELRAALYRLWPLLVHVRLFGGSYRAQVAATLTELGF